MKFILHYIRVELFLKQSEIPRFLALLFNEFTIAVQRNWKGSILLNLHLMVIKLSCNYWYLFYRIQVCVRRWWVLWGTKES